MVLIPQKKVYTVSVEKNIFQIFCLKMPLADLEIDLISLL